MSTGDAVTQVQPRDPALDNSPIAGPIEEESTVRLDQAAKGCVWNGQAFGPGERIEAEGVCYECSLGTWVTIER